jgi:uncharacterized protein YvpB
MKKNTNKKKIYIAIIIIVLCIIVIVLIWTLLSIKHNREVQEAYNEKQKVLYNNAYRYCSKLFTDYVINDNVTSDEVNNCRDKLLKVDDKEKTVNIVNDCDMAVKYFDLDSEVNNYYNNDIVISNVTIDNINELKEKNELIGNDIYKDKISNRINDIENNYNEIVAVKNSIYSLYSDYDNRVVRDNVTRNDYQEVLNLYNNLKQDDLINEYKDSLDNVINTIRSREREEARKRQEAINNSWVKLNVGYISQNENEVYNGCEAAALLMALHYKGYLSGTGLREYAEDMPKSDDPNTGFYLDIWGLDPTDVSHWIAPEALKNFGISSSGDSNIINATGYSFSQLTQEIVNGNPVLIYMTSQFRAPYNWSNGAPVNLHVQLLTGYNTMTGEVIIVDPWKYKSRSSYWTLSKATAESIYNQVGKRAVIVR